MGPERFHLFPTLCWLGGGGAFLHVLCGGGCALGLALMAGLAPAPILVLLWAFHLSLTTAGQEFLGFQWDNLLLETGLLAVFLAPPAWRLRWRERWRPTPVAVWLLRWLLFRLLFSSGLAKLASHDATWRNLTALTFHYETQPLPTVLGWWAHRLPVPMHQLCCVVMFVVELAIPFLVFGPRRLRRFAFFPLASLQLLIAATGNYAFFNLLTLALCLLLLDDGAFPSRWRDRTASRPAAPERRWPVFVVVPLAAVYALLSLVPLSSLTRWPERWPEPVVALYRWIEPFRTVSGYGLFAVMTTRRAEIVIEGSDDGETWLPYELRWKPGAVTHRPSFVAPHQPRLDWQLWFAALSRVESNPWFGALLWRLLEGSPEVLALFAGNPFPDAPPRYVRAVLYDYRFTDNGTRRVTGAWWRRELLGVYCRPLSLSSARQTSPWSSIESATFRKPAMLAPLT